jgi:hypothetical protein
MISFVVEGLLLAALPIILALRVLKRAFSVYAKNWIR